MSHFKTITNDGYIQSISTGSGQTPITEEEYNTIMNVIMTHAEEPGKGYRLRTDLTWEEYELPDQEEDQESDITAEEALTIIKGEK